ncbi:MAG: hypothetical protein HY749_17645 [Gammaproteobacteria bacterium]|nr:hypothetical protein [Gammaproteobacteria bacterium]MBI5616594.1 hypothetical protein [Gammaproteobacteria bacterium]
MQVSSRVWAAGRRAAIAAILMISGFTHVEAAGVVLFTNTCPAQSQTSQVVKDGVQAIKDAVDAGYSIRISQSDGAGAVWYEEIVALRLLNGPSTYLASGLLTVQPPQDGNGVPIWKNGFFMASVNTQGDYRWGQYLFGSDTWGLSSAWPVSTSTCIVTTWYKY